MKNILEAFRRRGIRKGLVFIPDISGFTELVHSTDVITGRMIIRELLGTLLRHNTLRMKVAEIEGDAIFFFKWKAIPSPDELYAQFEKMKTAFDKKVQELQYRFNIPIVLHLKAIAHFGEMAAYKLGGFTKIYGEVVVEAHRLLKNNVPGRSYLLITDELLAVSGKEADLFQAQRPDQLCELYHGLGSLCFSYILFEYFRPATAQFL